MSVPDDETRRRLLDLNRDLNRYLNQGGEDVKVISGGQNGADLAGLVAAKRAGLATGGWMPATFRTLDGPKPEYAKLFGVQPMLSPGYLPRTDRNVKDSDGTMRFAADFDSPGEVATWASIVKHRKPYFDVKVHFVSQDLYMSESLKTAPAYALAWLFKHRIKILNVAGNSDRTAPGIGAFVEEYLDTFFDLMKVEVLNR